MGWWAITKDNPGLNLNNPNTERYNGDGPADIMMLAIQEIIEEYQEKWHRLPYREELDAAFNFVADGYKLEDQNQEDEGSTK